MSEPEQEHPWGRHYKGQGRPRPPMMKLTKSGRIVITPEQQSDSPAPEKPAEKTPPTAAVPRPPADAANDAKPAAPKINWHEMPEIEVVTAADLERVRLETEAKRRRDMIAMFKLGAYCFLGVVLLAFAFEGIRYLLSPRPSEEQFAALREAVGQHVLRQFSSEDQPLELDSIEAEELNRARSRIDYELRVTMRLKAPLYAPADSNGVQAYLAMQRSVAEAHALVLQQRLFLENQEMATAPPMPMVIAVTHRVGEKRIVRVPVTAARGFWTWRTEPHLDRVRPIGAGFDGQILSLFKDENLLVFGTTEARDKMRRAMAAGRKFVIDVNREHTRRMRDER